MLEDRAASRGVLDRRNHLHLRPVIVELSSAIQAHDIRGRSRYLIRMRLTRLDGDRKRTVLVQTAEQHIEETKHLNSLRQGSADLPARWLTYKLCGSLRLTSCRYVRFFLASALRVREVMLGTALLSSAAFASLFVLVQFSFSLERFVARRFTLVLSGRSSRLVHHCSF